MNVGWGTWLMSDRDWITGGIVTGAWLMRKRMQGLWRHRKPLSDKDDGSYTQLLRPLWCPNGVNLEVELARDNFEQTWSVYWRMLGFIHAIIIARNTSSKIKNNLQHMYKNVDFSNYKMFQLQERTSFTLFLTPADALSARGYTSGVPVLLISIQRCDY
jgi:hypothetical protein